MNTLLVNEVDRFQNDRDDLEIRTSVSVFRCGSLSGFFQFRKAGIVEFRLQSPIEQAFIDSVVNIITGGTP